MNKQCKKPEKNLAVELFTNISEISETKLSKMEYVKFLKQLILMSSKIIMSAQHYKNGKIVQQKLENLCMGKEKKQGF